MLDELTGDFLREAAALLDKLEQALLAVEVAPSDAGRAESAQIVHRTLHTLKGNAGLLGATALQHALHVIEDRALSLGAEAGTSSVLLSAVDALRLELEAISSGRSPDVIGPALTAIVEGGSQLPAAQTAPAAESQLRIDPADLDALVTAAADLLVHDAALQRLASTGKPVRTDVLRDVVDPLARAARTVHTLSLRLRALPINPILQRYARVVRDEAAAQHKQVRLEIEATTARVDKALVDPVGEALVHLVRNAVAHGIEAPADRVRAGKPESGVIRLRAVPMGSYLELTIEDDGRGLDASAIKRRARELGLDERAAAESLIFRPGLSTSSLNASAGRGVGLDAVRSALNAVGGGISVQSHPGIGTCFTLRLPTSLALQRALLCDIGGDTWAVPSAQISEAFRLSTAHVRWLGKGRALEHGGRILPLVDTRALLGGAAADDGYALVIEAGGRAVLPVDKLLGQQEFVFHSLDRSLFGVGVGSGAALMGDGRVVVRLDPAQLVQSTEVRA